MNLIKFGDKLESGNYNFHSNFQNVMNFINQNQSLISVVRNDEYFSPNSLMFESYNNFNFKNFIVQPDFILINNKKIELKEDNKYSSIFNFPKSDFNFIDSKTKFLISIIKYLPHKSLLFLLEPLLEQNFTSMFEQEFVKTIKQGYQQILNKNYLKGIENIKARGTGLTPAGDDFVAGFLVALNLKNKCLNEENYSLKEKIYLISQTNNIFSKNFIKFAFEGFYFKRLNDFLNNFFNGNDDDLLNSTINLCKIGNSSGADLLSGFIVGLKF